MPAKRQDSSKALAAQIAGSAADAAKVAERRTQALQLVAELAPLETALLCKLAAGWSRRDIVVELGLADAAYEAHRTRLLETLKANSTTDAVRLAIYADLV